MTRLTAELAMKRAYEMSTEEMYIASLERSVKKRGDRLHELQVENQSLRDQLKSAREMLSTARKMIEENNEIMRGDK